VSLAIIAAVARNGVIGRDGALPWQLPEDLAHFRRVTAGCTVIMGRRTWESLPPKFRPLPGRHNIVVTRQPGWRAEGATVAADLDMALAAAGDAPRVFVIGGAELYAAALPRARELLLTEIDADIAGDVHFPAWPRSDFVEVARERRRSAGGVDFDFVTYRRI
jgi:dihydrofolate reductase